MANKAPPSRKAPVSSGTASPTAPAANSIAAMAKKANVIVLRAPNRLPALPQKIAMNNRRVAGRHQQAAGQFALPGDHHEQRPVDEERRPEAGAAEGDDPGEPQPRLRDEAADIGKRIDWRGVLPAADQRLSLSR